MERPVFPYSPNAYAISFEEVAGVCDCCGEQRTLRYLCSFHCAGDAPDYLCPWKRSTARPSAMHQGHR